MKNAPRKILIVEDDPDIVLALTTILEDEGYAVVAIDSGKHLSENMPPSDLPDLILLDMLLSGQDGREIARQLKADPSTRRIPILMLSAYPTIEQEAKAAGADSFLAKPFELDDLLAKVTSYLT
jgi:CheY-like chemotaxis protein